MISKTSLDNNQIIDDLLKISNAIDVIYKKIAKDDKNSAKYFDYLKITLDVENNYYQKLNLPFEKILEINNYLINNLLPDNGAINFSAVLSGKRFNRAVGRIMLNLQRICSKDVNYIEHIYQSTFANNLPEPAPEMDGSGILYFLNASRINPAEIKNSIKQSLDIQLILEEELVHATLAILKDRLKNKDGVFKNKKFEEFYNNIKYDLIITNPMLEQKLIKSEFKNEDNYCFMPKKIAEINNFDPKFFNEKVYEAYADVFNNTFNQILMINGTDYSQNNLLGILNQSCIRAVFLAFNNQTIDETLNNSMITINLFEQDYNKNYSWSKQLIMQAALKKDSDKEKFTNLNGFDNIFTK